MLKIVKIPNIPYKKLIFALVKKIDNMKPIYVTFQIRHPKVLGFPTKYFAVRCKSEDDAKCVASNVYSLDGISHIRFNKCGRFGHKVKIFENSPRFEKEIM